MGSFWVPFEESIFKGRRIARRARGVAAFLGIAQASTNVSAGLRSWLMTHDSWASRKVEYWSACLRWACVVGGPSGYHFRHNMRLKSTSLEFVRLAIRRSAPIHRILHFRHQNYWICSRWNPGMKSYIIWMWPMWGYSLLLQFINAFLDIHKNVTSLYLLKMYRYS